MNRLYGLTFLTAPELDPISSIQIAAECGYQYVGLRLVPATPQEPQYPLLQDKKLAEKVRREAEQSGVSVLDVELIRVDEHFQLESKLPFLEAAARIGAKHINIACNDADYVRMQHHFAVLCEASRPFGLSCDIEFLPWTVLKDLNDTRQFLIEVNQPNGALMIDALHWARSATASKFDLQQVPESAYNYVQICDALLQYDPSPEGLIHIARSERLMPGQGELDLKAFLEAVPADKPVGIEVPNTQLFKQYSAKDRAKMAIQAVESLFESTAEI